MAEVIEFYVPLRYKPKKWKWLPESQRGWIIEFRPKPEPKPLVTRVAGVSVTDWRRIFSGN